MEALAQGAEVDQGVGGKHGEQAPVAGIAQQHRAGETAGREVEQAGGVLQAACRGVTALFEGQSAFVEQLQQAFIGTHRTFLPGVFDRL